MVKTKRLSGVVWTDDFLRGAEVVDTVTHLGYGGLC